MPLRRLSLWFVLASLAVIACRPKSERVTQSSEAPAAATSAAVQPAPTTSPSTTPTRPLGRSLRPVGPPHAVEPGKGLGPIMFGATVPTIERHMGMKCEVLTETRCRMITAGVEFELKSGVVSAIQIHRFDRPVEEDSPKLWGVFAGGIPPNVLMAMVPEAVIEGIGKPKKTEVITKSNLNGTVRRDFYDGMVLEYDLNKENDRLMLGGIRIVKK